MLERYGSEALSLIFLGSYLGKLTSNLLNQHHLILSSHKNDQTSFQRIEHLDSQQTSSSPNHTP